MADQFALRAYRTEVGRRQHHILRAVQNLRTHLDSAERFAAGGLLTLSLNTLGADTANLVEAVAALNALREASYLVEEG